MIGRCVAAGISAGRPLEPARRAYLDRLDQRTGIVIGQLPDAVSTNDSRGIALLYRRLAQHMPELDVIRIENAGGDYRVELGYGDAGAA